MTAVPERSAEAAVTVAAFLTAAAALATPGPTPSDPTAKNAAAAASDTAAAEARTRRRRGWECRVRDPGAPASSATSTAVVTIRARSGPAAASTDSAKPALARGLALRRAWKLPDEFMMLLRETCVVVRGLMAAVGRSRQSWLTPPRPRASAVRRHHEQAGPRRRCGIDAARGAVAPAR